MVSPISSYSYTSMVAENGHKDFFFEKKREKKEEKKSKCPRAAIRKKMQVPENGHKIEM